MVVRVNTTNTYEQEERAAIIEYESNKTRKEAERLAGMVRAPAL